MAMKEDQIEEKEFGKETFQDAVFLSIQRNLEELEKIQEEFRDKYVEQMNDWEDYCADFELTKTIMAEHKAFRDVAKRYLDYNPDDISKHCVR